MPARHVVLFIADQMQYQRLGCVDEISRTPELDRLGAEGAAFSNMFCTSPQCTPSRVSMQTGLYPHEADVLTIYGFDGHTGHLPPTRMTVGRAFQEAGWTTAFFGKTHLGHPLTALGYDVVAEHGVGPRLSEVDRAITDDALQLIAAHDADTPLFMTVSWHEPHPPFEDVEPFVNDFPLEAMSVPASHNDTLEGKPPYQARRRDMPHGGADADRLRQELRSYYSMISHVDSLVGKVRHALEAKGMWDDSAVLFTSDHGDMMGAHGFRLKGVLPYDELFRIPFILKSPQIPAGQTVEDLCVNAAQPGTLLEAAGLPVPRDFKGGSVFERAQRPALPTDECIFLEHFAAYWGTHPFRIARTPSWKYVKHYGEGSWEELYDLTHDPSELMNLVPSGKHEDVRRQLAGRVDAWWEDTGGRDLAYYQSDDFRGWGEATLVSDNELWTDPASSR